MGEPLSAFKVDKIITKNLYQVQVARTNDEFEYYTAFITPHAGLCKIMGVGITHSNDSDGSAIRVAFSQMHSVLTQKYGASRDFDYLDSGSIWHDTTDYAMALTKKERVLDSFWDHQEGSNLTDNVQSIQLAAWGLGSSSDYLRLNYEYSNLAACQAEDKQSDTNAL